MPPLASGRKSRTAPLSEQVLSSVVGPYVATLTALHDHLCPRQVLGVRMALHGAEALGLALPRTDKRLLLIAETDGCFVDGLQVASGCTVGHRTLRVVDHGKVAATFVDTHTKQAVRVIPRTRVRELALAVEPDAPSRWHAQRDAYALLPVEHLLSVTPVELLLPVSELVGRMGKSVLCAGCGEEVINQRYEQVDGRALCRACTDQPYLRPITPANSEAA